MSELISLICWIAFGYCIWRMFFAIVDPQATDPRYFFSFSKSPKVNTSKQEFTTIGKAYSVLKSEVNSRGLKYLVVLRDDGSVCDWSDFDNFVEISPNGLWTFEEEEASWM